MAAVFDAETLPCLPDLVAACSAAKLTDVTVCTLPSSLRASSPREAGLMLDALAACLPHIRGAHIEIRGSSYYLPCSIRQTIDDASKVGSSLKLRLAIDYASQLRVIDEVGLLLLPAGMQPGNLLRWHFARARWVEVDWRRFGPADLSAHLGRQPGTAREPAMV